MAGKVKSVYLTITRKDNPLKTEFRRTFFNVVEYNQYTKTEEFQAKWPAEEYNLIKEIY
jgi:hypothetical protein